MECPPGLQWVFWVVKVSHYCWCLHLTPSSLLEAVSTGCKYVLGVGIGKIGCLVQALFHWCLRFAYIKAACVEGPCGSDVV